MVNMLLAQLGAYDDLPDVDSSASDGPPSSSTSLPSIMSSTITPPPLWLACTPSTDDGPTFDAASDASGETLKRNSGLRIKSFKSAHKLSVAVPTYVDRHGSAAPQKAVVAKPATKDAKPAAPAPVAPTVYRYDPYATNNNIAVIGM